jgi:hypothetical protein
MCVSLSLYIYMIPYIFFLCIIHDYSCSFLCFSFHWIQVRKEFFMFLIPLHRIPSCTVQCRYQYSEDHFSLFAQACYTKKSQISRSLISDIQYVWNRWTVSEKCTGRQQQASGPTHRGASTNVTILQVKNLQIHPSNKINALNKQQNTAKLELVQCPSPFTDRSPLGFHSSSS